MPTESAIQSQATETKISSHHAMSYIFLALAFLAIADVSARIFYQCRRDLWPVSSYDSPNRSLTWWATNDIRKLDKTPDVVLLGSSLINTPVTGAEATYLNIPVDACLNHRSTYMENQMSLPDKKNPLVFSLAIPGQMASDAYAMASTLLKGKSKPKVIIWGIAPRDFLDCELFDATCTETFKLMSRLRKMDELQSLSRASIWDSAAHELGQVSFLYAHKSDFVFLQHRLLNRLVAKVEHKDMDTINLPCSLRREALYEFLEDRGPHELMIMPYDRAHPLFTDDTKEYRWRYREFRPKVFATQLTCLKYMTKFANDNGIALFVVNMPLLPENLALLPKSTYHLYLDEASKAVVSGGGHFINLQSPEIAQQQYYLDSAHLNGIGGEKLLDKFAQILNQSTQLASTKNSQI